MAQKLEELKKICMREAVSVCFGIIVRVIFSPHTKLTPVVVFRSLQEDCLKSIPWRPGRKLL